MKVGVISDTHISSLKAGTRLAEYLLAGPFKNVAAILHAGDHVHPDLDSCFSPVPFYAVCGNMDKPNLHLPERRIVQIAGKRIGMCHGWGPPNGIEQRVLDSFSRDKLDVLVFGHSHRPACRKVGSVLLLNPGSPTDRRSAAFHTVALLHLCDAVSGEIIRID
ncbi:MAG: metallophosphoesterase [Deltaproteobacteria bacterium]|jgi:putative phosphoesterase|nr:metallophosphoesterase [Deltaproteobacteria bacterium]MCW8891695.1 metallophosphoesterase [Deltaproteobacteria bacterium]